MLGFCTVKWRKIIDIAVEIHKPFSKYPQRKNEWTQMYVLIELEEQDQIDLGIWQTFVSFDNFLNYQRNQIELDAFMAKSKKFLIEVPMGEGGGASRKAKKSPYSKYSLQFSNHIYVNESPDY